MEAWIGVTVLAAVVLVALVAGTIWSRRTGRVVVAPEDTVRREPADGDARKHRSIAELVAPTEAQLTLLQFSTRYCTYCPGTARALSGLAAEFPDGAVRHVEVDVTDRPDLVRLHGILQSPTTLVATSTGAELARVRGPARIDEIRRLLDSTLHISEPEGHRS